MSKQMAKSYQTVHTATRTGSRVKVEMANGRVVFGKFFDRDSNYVYVDTEGGRVRLRRGHIVKFGDYRKQS